MTSAPHGASESLADEPFFEALVARSRRTNIARVEQLAQLVASCRKTRRADQTQVSRLAELAHQVVGSAGTFGFGQVSDLGRDFEHVLVRSTEPTVADLMELDQLAAAMLMDLQSV
ncbi:MAG: Hpt domain-containing protein [Propionibacteriaceae bacterium]